MLHNSMSRPKGSTNKPKEEMNNVGVALGENPKVTKPATCGWCGKKVEDIPEVFCSPECEQAKAARS